MSTITERLTTALADRYVIERELGAGGMATVYLAHDVRRDRKVALKVLRPELSAIVGAERFLAEIKTTANLQHPHILSLFDSSGDAGPGHPQAMTDDWFEVLHALLDADAKFLVIGAHAMAVHGVPRGTQDLEVWVEPSSENADKVWRALAGFGAPLHSIGVTLADLNTAGTVVQFGLPPNRIDVLTDISGVADFSAAWAARREYDVHGRSVPFIGREALIANKRASGRPKDLADLDALGELPRA